MLNHRGLTILLVACSAMASIAGALSQSSVRDVKVRILEGDYSSLTDLELSDPAEALPLLRSSALDNRTPELSSTALDVLKSIPNIEEVIANDIKSEISSGYVEPSIKKNFDLLALLGIPDAAKHIALFLDSNIVLKSGMADVADESVRAQAAIAMQQFGFPSGPTRGGAKRGVTLNEVEQWKGWWKKNATQIEDLVIEARKNPAPMPTRVPAYTTTAPTPPSKPKPLPSPIAQMPSPNQTAPAETPLSEPEFNFPIIPVAVIAALLIAGVVFILRRKTP